MSLITPKSYFLTLSLLATFLLWGLSLLNGTVKALILTSWHQRLPDGSPFPTTYTGIFPLDFPISLLVAFFYYGTNGHDTGYNHFLIDAYSTLQSAFVWLYVESGRATGGKPYGVARPIIYGILWQCFGAAISLPLYFSVHIPYLSSLFPTSDSPSSNPSPLPLPSLPFAISLPFSFLIGAVLPAIIGMLPTWVPRSPVSHQRILAAWQPDPVWVSLLQFLGVFLTSRVLASRDTGKDEKRAFQWVRGTYLLAALSSTIGHVYTFSKVLSGGKGHEFNFVRLYVPKTITGIREGNILVDGPWEFLQWDLIIIALSSLSWAYILLVWLIERPGNGSKGKAAGIGGRLGLALLFLVGFVVIGAGGTVSLALWWREGELKRRREEVVERVRKGLLSGERRRYGAA